MDCYSIKHLSFRYPDSDKDALTDITFSVAAGEFVTICGLSGCGKSTLLRQLKTCLRPAGERQGEILFQGKPLEDTDERTQASAVGFVFQSPEHQCVTDKVWHELAFGLEGLGTEQGVIRRRTAEMAAFFGMEKWFGASVEELSGGQRQILALASVMVMQPSVLILDEPTAQLDPVAAYEFVSLLRRINTEFSTTVIISEHSLDEVLPVSDRLIVLSQGRIISDTSPLDAPGLLYDTGDPVFLSMPAPARVYEYADGISGKPPLSSSQGRRWLSGFVSGRDITPYQEKESASADEKKLSVREVWYRYEKDSPDILKSLSIDIYKGEVLTILGGNGAGKTTLLSLLSGESKAQRGRMYHEGRRVPAFDPARHHIALLPQEVQALFVRSTVREELFDVFRGSGIDLGTQSERVREAAELCELGALLEMHPFDLSGGEQQRAALAKLILTEPEILLLAEPTKGLDCFFKRSLAEILHSLAEKGTAVVAVSHDLEFCASYADRCALLFDGIIISTDKPQGFFSENGIYTTSVSRMSKGIVDGAVTVPQLLSALDTENRDDSFYTGLKKRRSRSEEISSASVLPLSASKPERSRIRMISSLVTGALFLFFLFVTTDTITLPFAAYSKPFAFVGLFFSAAVFMVIQGGSQRIAIAPVRSSIKSRIISAVSMFALVPLTVLFGVYFLDDTKYLFISLLVMAESIVPFYIMFEKRSIRARELVLTASVCAVTVAGRAVFYMLPECKPVTAVVMLAGAALGSESGFMIGSVSMLASNIFFGQGIWTPWQMFTMGLIGYISGLIFHRGLLPANRMSFALCGFASALIIYGGIMNPSALIMSGTPVTAETLFSVYALGLPIDTVHALATALFLSVGAMPVLAKLERIKKKFDLIR